MHQPLFSQADVDAAMCGLCSILQTLHVRQFVEQTLPVHVYVVTIYSVHTCFHGKYVDTEDAPAARLGGGHLA
jgi:hypothetical protein